MPGSRIPAALNWPDERLLGLPFQVPRGTILSRQGTTVGAVLLLMGGVARLSIRRDDRDVLVAVRTPGWLLGAAPVLCGVRFTSTAVALTACELALMSLETLRATRTRPDVSLWLQDMLSREVLDQLQRSAATAVGDCRDRVESLFADLFTAIGAMQPDGSARLPIVLTVTDIAMLVGAAREHVSRLLTCLERDGVFTRSKGWLSVPATSPWLPMLASDPAVRRRSRAAIPWGEVVVPPT
jgi:CRP-like cAMP-binding protein